MHDAVFCGRESQRISTAFPKGTSCICTSQSLPNIHYKEYLFQLTLHCVQCLGIFPSIIMIPTQVHHYQPKLPSVDVKCDECLVTVGKVTKVKIMFRNPLSRSLSRLLFLVQAQGLFAQRELSYR